MHGAIAVMDDAQIGPPMATGGRWYALLVMAGVERRACIWMRLRGMWPYWPRYEVGHRDFKSRRSVIWRSVIPGYIFLPVPANCWLVEEAPGVRRIMRNGRGGFAEIPDGGKEGIEQIRDIEASLNANPVAAREGIPFKVGQQVHVSRLDMTGKILKLDGRRRIVVSVPLFGSSIPMTVSVGDIESV